MSTQLFSNDRLDAWYDGSGIHVVAVGTLGEPLDLGEDEVEAFIEKLKMCLREVAASQSGAA